MTAPAPMTSAEPIKIRCSALTLWPDCERRAAARLFKSIIGAKGFFLRTTSIHVGAPIGTGVHAGAAFGLQTKIDTGELSSLSDATDVALTGFDQALEEVDNQVEWKPGVAGNRDQGQKQVIRMLAMVHLKLSPTINPAAVEDRLEADIGDGFILSGQRDIYGVEVHNHPPAYPARYAADSWKIKDLKTGVGSGSHMPQIGAYGILARSHGNRVDGAEILHVPRVPLKKPQPKPTIIAVDIEEAERSAERTYERAKASMIEFMKTGDHHAFQANPASKLCNESCPAWGTNFCKEHLEIE